MAYAPGAAKLAAILAADVAGYSRLAAADEERTLARLRALRSDLIDPTIAEHHGRVVKRTGDGTLVEFRSVVDAVRCAIEVQNGMVERNAGLPPECRIEFRVGIHLGDVVEESDGDLMGDGVNIAARLEGIAETGGICISRQAYDQVEGKLALAYRSLGPQNLKNIPKSVEVYAIDFVGSQAAGQVDPDKMKLKVNYCRAPDGVRIAYATVGSGPPLVKTANWMNHVEYDWEGPLRFFLVSLARDFTLLRYDARGNGLSDWEVDELSLDAWVSDLETVVNAAGLDRFPLFGMSQGCAISVAFAVRHPERVSRLILYGGFARGAYHRAKNELELQKAKALATLIRTGWGEDTPAFRTLFSSLFMPEGTQEQLQKFAELQRKTTTAECAYRYFETTRNLDVSNLLSKVTIPTLVIHVRDDQVQPFEAGRELATGIPGARFVALQGQNHAPLEQDPATARMIEEIKLFLKS